MKKNKLAETVKAQQNKLTALEKLVSDLSLRIENMQQTICQQQRCNCSNDRNQLFGQLQERYRA